MEKSFMHGLALGQAAMTYNTGAMRDAREIFSNRESWEAYKQANPWVSDAAYIASIGEHARQHGVNSHFLGASPAHDVEVTPGQLRESIIARGISSRVRAVLDELAGAGPTSRILMLEAVTPFAQHVGDRFPHALGTEYLPDAEARARFPGVRHLDITAADLPNSSFDCIVSNDVLEHVPSLDRALLEMRRLLRPGSRNIAVFPFAPVTTVRAQLRADGTIEHLLPPEYHGDPVRAEGALVFAIPGWDVLDRARSAGFAQANMLFVSSIERGITGNQLAGVFVLEAIA